MVLSRPDILKRIGDGELAFNPPVSETSIEQVSIDLRLGHTFTHFKAPASITAVRVTRELFKDASLWVHTKAADAYFLQKHEFVIAHTLEEIKLPNHLMGLVGVKAAGPGLV